MTISLVSDITLKSSQVVYLRLTNTIQNTIYTHSEQPQINAMVVNFHISGTKWASAGTRDTVVNSRTCFWHLLVSSSHVTHWLS